MRVTNNLLVFNQYKNTQNNNLQSRPYFQNNMDTVNFSARYKTPRISGDPAIFNQATQDIMQGIYTKLKTIKTFFADMLPVKASKIKQDYEPLLIYKGNKGHTFILKDNSDGIETITIARSNKKSNIVRLVVRTSDKQTTHYLIDGLDKAVANVNQNAPFMMPPSYRYMTKEQIAESGVKKYINLADEELTKYVDFLENYGKPNKVQEIMPESEKATKIIQTTHPQLSEIKPNKLINLFDTAIESLPKHINPQISPSTGKMVGFNMTTDDGSVIRVLKAMNPDYGDQLKYLSIRKVSPNGEKQFISIDLLNKEVLKTDQKTGKPIISHNAVYHYTPQELVRENIVDDFNAIMKEIFRNPKSSDKSLSQEVTVLKLKEKPQLKQEKEFSIEDFEDEKLNHILSSNNGELGAEVASAPKKRGRKPRIKQSDEQTTEVIKTPQKRGRKPKAKSSEPQPISAEKNILKINDDITQEIAKQQTDVIAKANKDADNLAELYFKTFVSRFKETLGQKMADFKAKYDELFNV